MRATPTHCTALLCTSCRVLIRLFGLPPVHPCVCTMCALPDRRRRVLTFATRRSLRAARTTPASGWTSWRPPPTTASTPASRCPAARCSSLWARPPRRPGAPAPGSTSRGHSAAAATAISAAVCRAERRAIRCAARPAWPAIWRGAPAHRSAAGWGCSRKERARAAWRPLTAAGPKRGWVAPLVLVGLGLWAFANHAAVCAPR